MPHLLSRDLLSQIMVETRVIARQLTHFYERRAAFLILLILALSPIYGGLAATLLTFCFIINVFVWAVSRPRMSTLALLFLLCTGGYIGFFTIQGILFNQPIISTPFFSNLPLLGAASFLMLNAKNLKFNPSWLLLIPISLLTVLSLYFLFKGLCNLGITHDWVIKAFHGNCNGRLRMGGRNALMTGGMIMLLSFWAIQFASISSWRWRKSIIFFAITTGVYLVVFAIESRGATLAAILVLSGWGGYAILNAMKYKLSAVRQLCNTYALSTSLIVCVGILFTVLFTPTFMESSVVKRNVAVLHQLIDPEKVVDRSVWIRLEMYKGGVNAFFERPLMGHGYAERYDAPARTGVELSIGQHAHIHQSLLNHAVAGGIVGVFLYLALLALPLIQVFTRIPLGHSYQLAGATGVVAFIGVGLTTATLGHFVNTTFWGLVLIMPWILEYSIEGE